jgi:hypothetical protein
MKTSCGKGRMNKGRTFKGVRRKIAITYGTVGTFHLITSSTVGTRYKGLSREGAYAVRRIRPLRTLLQEQKERQG